MSWKTGVPDVFREGVGQRAIYSVMFFQEEKCVCVCVCVSVEAQWLVGGKGAGDFFLSLIYAFLPKQEEKELSVYMLLFKNPSNV